jgi:hypothetical protein
VQQIVESGVCSAKKGEKPAVHREGTVCTSDRIPRSEATKILDLKNGGLAGLMVVVDPALINVGIRVPSVDRH